MEELSCEAMRSNLEALGTLKKHEDGRTYFRKDAFDPRNAFTFVRPLANDLVAQSGVMNVSDEKAMQYGLHLLDSAEVILLKSKPFLLMKKPGYDFGFPRFDNLLILGPKIMNFTLKGAYFLPMRTYGTFAINNIEYVGDETEAEAVYRKKHVILSDMTREITPIIFCRYHKQTGQRSAEHFGVAKFDLVETWMKELPRDGGTVEIENFERTGMGFAANRGESELDVTFDGKTQKLSMEEALKIMGTHTHKGAGEAKKGW
jgi:hypothetical protein